MNLNSLLSELENLEKNLEVDYLSLRSVIRKDISASVRNETFEGIQTSTDSGIMVEVMVNGHFGYGATNSMDLNEVKKAALTAKELAVKTGQYALTAFDLEQRPATVGNYKSPAKLSIDSFNPKEMIELMTELTNEMKISPLIVTRSAYFSLSELNTHFVSTNGADITQQITRSTMGLSVTAADENGNQNRSFGGDMPTQFGIEIYNKDILKNEAKRISKEALELLNAPECPTEEMDLILAPDQLYLQIHESIGHPLELDRILGDERNYAGWSFVKPKDFGNLKYGSSLMNITFDPTMIGESASYFADDIGAPASKQYLIKDGILLRGLGSLESQKRLGLEGVASQRATSWNRAPIDRMANVNLEPGQSSLNDMIKSVKRGIIMRTTRSWSIDDYRNKFQFGCEYAELIEDGKITKVVKNPNYRGITAPFWNKLKMVGDQSTFEIGGANNCGKGEPNQVIFVGHASPACLFEKVEVFGGGK